MQIVDKFWFSPGRSDVGIGIVIINDQYDGIKAYIGTGNASCLAATEEEDAQHIADWGARLHKSILKGILERIEAAEKERDEL